MPNFELRPENVRSVVENLRTSSVMVWLSLKILTLQGEKSFSFMPKKKRNIGKYAMKKTVLSFLLHPLNAKMVANSVLYFFELLTVQFQVQATNCINLKI